MMTVRGAVSDARRRTLSFARVAVCLCRGVGFAALATGLALTAVARCRHVASHDNTAYQNMRQILPRNARDLAPEFNVFTVVGNSSATSNLLSQDTQIILYRHLKGTWVQ